MLSSTAYKIRVTVDGPSTCVSPSLVAGIPFLHSSPKCTDARRIAAAYMNCVKRVLFLTPSPVKLF